MLPEKDDLKVLAHKDGTDGECEEGESRRLRHSTIQLRTATRTSEYPTEPPPSMEPIPPNHVPSQLASIIDDSKALLLANDPGIPVPGLGKQEVAADSQDFVRYIPESLTSAELNEQVTREIADAFREIFCNNAEYMVCQGCDNLIGASQAFDLPPDTNVPLSLLDSNLANACCDKCNSPMELLYDPERTYEMFKEKFSHDAFVTLLRSPRTRQIVGFTFAYERPMREVFEHEWKSRYMYTKETNPVAYNDYEEILQTAGPVLTKEVGYTIDDETPIFCWNCVAISPTLRGSGAIKTMMSDFALSLPSEVVATRAVLGETRRGSKFHGILTSANMRTIEVGSEDYVLIGGALKNKCDRWVQTGLKKSA
jgi:hypothetical protein